MSSPHFVFLNWNIYRAEKTFSSQNLTEWTLFIFVQPIRKSLFISINEKLDFIEFLDQSLTSECTNGTIWTLFSIASQDRLDEDRIKDSSLHISSSLAGWSTDRSLKFHFLRVEILFPCSLRLSHEMDKSFFNRSARDLSFEMEFFHRLFLFLHWDHLVFLR